MSKSSNTTQDETQIILLVTLWIVIMGLSLFSSCNAKAEERQWSNSETIQIVQNIKSKGSKTSKNKRSNKKAGSQQGKTPTNLGANRGPVLCDCSNCSAEHCPRPNPGRGNVGSSWIVEEGNS